MDTLLYIDWSVDPAIFSIAGREIRYYGLFFALSFLVGVKLIEKIFVKENIDLKILDKLFIHVMVGTVVGARLGHCLFYHPEDYLSNPIEILFIWEGGLASHGGAIGVALALWRFYAKVYNKKSILWLMDRTVIAVAISCVFIRLGNLFNHEIIGHETDVPWAFIFREFRMVEVGPNEFVQKAFPLNPKHPVQLYESLSYLFIFIVLYLGEWKWNWDKYRGRLFGFLLTGVFTARFIIEFFKEKQVNDSHFSSESIFNMGHLLSVPFILIGIYFLIKSFKNETVQ